MMDYCNCGRRRIDETFLSGGLIFCIQCKQALFCDVTVLDPRLRLMLRKLPTGKRFSAGLTVQPSKC